MIAADEPALAPSRRPTPASPAVEVRRLIYEAGEGLQYVQSSPLLSEGRVNMISVEDIAERLGSRWEVRRAQVYDHVEKVLSRKIGPTGLLLRITECDYLVVQPDHGVFAGQAVCVRALTEIMHFFLGPARRRDLAVHRVTKLSGSEIVGLAVDPRAAAEGERREARAAEAAAEAARERDYLMSPERWSPFVASSGRRVRVSCHLEPVYELKNQTRIGYRLHRRILDMATGREMPQREVRGLSRADLLRVDMATISRGMARVMAAAEHERELSLLIPVSFVTLSNKEGRSLISKAFEHAREAVEKGLICEVYGIDGAPQVALLEAVSLIKPGALFVVGNLTDDPPVASAALKEAGLQALSIECPRDFRGDAEFIGWLRAALTSLHRATKSVMVYGCESPRRAAMAALLGASHASFTKPTAEPSTA